MTALPNLLPNRDAKDGTVLIVDDDPIGLQVMENCLESHYRVVGAGSGAEALAQVAACRPDLILLDVLMPGMDGYQVCAQLKSSPDTADIPVIFLTVRSDLESEKKGLEMGAVDYLSKPFMPALVRARVRNHVELKRARDRLTAMAMIDGLTGIANRRYFDSALDGELRRLKRTEGDIGLLLLDIDHFKSFNDTYGHLEGDDCLRLVAETLTSCVKRPFDVVARYGGEEFACILPETDFAGAMGIAERVLAAIGALEIPHSTSGLASHVTVSIGVTAAHCKISILPKALLKTADRQLYQAKMDGRARVSGALF